MNAEVKKKPRSVLLAAVFCSLLAHFILFNAAWFPLIERMQVATPWRDAGLRVRFSTPARPSKDATAARPPRVAPKQSEQAVPPRRPAPVLPIPARPSAQEPGAPQAGKPRMELEKGPSSTAPAGQEQPPVAAPSSPPDTPPQAPAAQLAPAEPPSAPSDAPGGAEGQTFADPGGVDEQAKPLREPEFALPWGSSSLNSWRMSFDLLIDAEGKVVRVDAVKSDAPGAITGAVLAAFFTLPFEPAKLAGRPIASRQRFEVNP